MIEIGELKGAKMKKEMGAENINKRYHNKNKQGGNFGFTIIKGGNWYNLSGYYNTEGKVVNLRFGTFSSAGIPINPTNFDELCEAVKGIIVSTEAFNFMEEAEA